jgi:hypothetical protein
MTTPLDRVNFAPAGTSLCCEICNSAALCPSVTRAVIPPRHERC